MRLAFFLADPRAAADDLLELRHGADHFVQNDQFCHFAIDARGEQLGRRGDDRIRLRHGDEIIQFLLAVVVAARDADDVVRILLHHVGIVVDERDAHPFGGVLRRAEDDGLRHAVDGLEIFRDFRGDLLDAVFDDDGVVVVAVRVDAVFDGIAVFVQLAFERPPAFADVRLDVDDFERREEAVLDAFLQAVHVDRISEIIDVGDVSRLLRRGRHADLRGGAEIFQNAAPRAVVLRGAAVAFIDDDQIEEIRLEQLGEMLLPVFADKLLIQGEIDLIRREGGLVVFRDVELVDDLLQRFEILLDRLVH